MKCMHFTQGKKPYPRSVSLILPMVNSWYFNNKLSIHNLSHLKSSHFSLTRISLSDQNTVGPYFHLFPKESLTPFSGLPPTQIGAPYGLSCLEWSPRGSHVLMWSWSDEKDFINHLSPNLAGPTRPVTWHICLIPLHTVPSGLPSTHLEAFGAL